MPSGLYVKFDKNMFHVEIPSINSVYKCMFYIHKNEIGVTSICGSVN